MAHVTRRTRIARRTTPKNFQTLNFFWPKMNFNENDLWRDKKSFWTWGLLNCIVQRFYLNWSLTLKTKSCYTRTFILLINDKGKESILGPTFVWKLHQVQYNHPEFFWQEGFSQFPYESNAPVLPTFILLWPGLWHTRTPGHQYNGTTWQRDTRTTGQWVGLGCPPTVTVL